MAAEREREKPVQQLSVSELKTRLLKVAQAYKAQRVKNGEFES
jgi:hypothetical protein